MVRTPYLIAVVWLALTASYVGWQVVTLVSEGPPADMLDARALRAIVAVGPWLLIAIITLSASFASRRSSISARVVLSLMPGIYAGWLSISPLAALPGPTLVTLYGSIGVAVAIACAYVMGAPEPSDADRGPSRG